MDDKLRSLISSASDRLKAAETVRVAARQLEERQKMDENAEAFKWNVETGLGAELLSALGSVSFDEERLEPSMTFQLQGRTFRLKAILLPPGLAQIEEVTQGGFSSVPLHPQFNLVRQANAKDIFLDTLGKALADAGVGAAK